jgi:cytochrome c-type biogenesis protein CcsB
MPVVINSGLADASNVFLLTTVILYALAMLSYACDFAFRKERLLAPEPATAPASASAATAGVAPGAKVAAGVVPELVTVGGSAPGGAGSAGSDLGPDGPGSSSASNGSITSGSASSGSASSGSASNGSVAAGSPRDGSARLALAGTGGPGGGAARWPTGFWLRAAFGLTVLGFLLHLTAVVTRGLAEHRVPWGNMYEFIAAIALMAVAVLIAAAVRFRAYYLGLFVLLPVVLALALDVTVIYTPAGSLVPALNSYWLEIHVTAMIVASGLYIVGAVVTVLYLLADRSERRAAAGLPSRSSGLMMHLPETTVLDRLSYRAILFAFPVWTFGVMCGAIWADHAWGRYWGWDPKETWSFITWVVYAGFLHARATAGWRGRKAASTHPVGFCCLMFNLVGINLWVTGLHSYAGISG